MVAFLLGVRSPRLLSQESLTQPSLETVTSELDSILSLTSIAAPKDKLPKKARHTEPEGLIACHEGPAALKAILLNACCKAVMAAAKSGKGKGKKGPSSSSVLAGKIRFPVFHSTVLISP